MTRTEISSIDAATQAVSGMHRIVRPPQTTPVVLASLLGISMVIHVGCLVACRIWFPNSVWVLYPLHAAVETSGALIALWVAWTLLRLEERGIGTSFNVWIASGLIAMGTLDGAHGLMEAGPLFVWTHSSATFLGGLLFAATWCPSDWQKKLRHRLPIGVLVMCLLLVTLFVVWPRLIPPMVIGKNFSGWAIALNFLGGFFLLAAGARLIVAWVTIHNADDLLFCLHFVLFAAAAFMFQLSKLWDLPWWGWHFLRLLAYAFALLFVVLTELRDQQAFAVRAKELARLSATLEQRVHEMTREVREKNAILQRSNEDLEEFAYIASHDLQEPLRKIKSFGDMLVSTYQNALGAEGQDYLKRMQKAAGRMQSLITDLLTFARVSSKARPFVPVDLSEITAEVLCDLESRIKSTNGSVNVQPLPTIESDAIQMRQLMQNLIGNGLKFHRNGIPPFVSVEGHVRQNRSDEPEFCEITVSDNGIGFEEKFRDRIFTPFQRLHGLGQYEGTGIGLAICKKIVERHSGTITARSTPGEGTTFIITLPIRQSRGANDA